MPASQSLPRSALPLAGSTFTLPNHPSFSEFLAINDLGDIVADIGAEKPTAAYVGHLPYGQGDFKQKSFPGAVTTTATALNDSGLVAGFYTDANGNIAAFTERKGVWTNYRNPSGITEYLGVNDAATTVGFYTDRRGMNHAFARDAKTGKLVYIRPAGGVSVTASAINDGGEVVGYMRTSRGRVEGFLGKGDRITELLYPGASETKALGISNDGRIVGTYNDAAGATHGFILRGAAAIPQWQTFDAPKARGMTVLTGISSGGQLVGYYADESHLRALLVRGLKPLSSQIPLVIPVWGMGGDGVDADPGATPDQHLFAAVWDNSEYSSSSLAKNCPGVRNSSTCQPYKYSDFFYLHCATVNSLAAYQWADANDESAFLHNYPNGQTPSNRVTFAATPNPNCKPDSHNAVMRMNPGDSGYNTWLYNNIWNGSHYRNDFPSPFGVMEDQASVPAWLYVGGSGVVTTEYGSGTKPSGFATQVGNSQYHAATDFETAIGLFINGACSSKCVDVALNGPASGAGNIGPCSVIRNGHCHGQGDSGSIDDQAAIDNICKEVAQGNLTYFVAERPIWMGRFGFGFLNSQSMTFAINTSANVYSHTSDSCAATKMVDLETSYGPGGLGDVSGGYPNRIAALAYRWLVPNPSTGMPDRVISSQYSEGGTGSEAPYFFEDTLVPYGAETQVPKFVWNGKVQTVGGGCPSVAGDSGGAVSLVVQCVGSAGIYCQQYQHLYINGADYGNAAACLNTSTTTKNIVSSWFKHDPISSYSYELSLQGGEMTSVPYQTVLGGLIALTTCTSVKYCTGQNTLLTQVAPFKGNGSDSLCGPCGVILLHND